MKHLKSIVVGIDYSSPSDNALREAARIAAWDNAKLSAIHVVDSEVLADLERGVKFDRASVLALGKQRLEAHISDILGKGVDVTTENLVGHPFAEMVRAAEAAAAGLVVIGSRGGASTDSHRVGAQAERCLRKMRQNVLLVRGHQSAPFRRVVACVDFSKTARQAARQALHIAQQDGSELEFLHVRQPVGETIVHPDFYTGSPSTMLPEYDRILAENTEQQLEVFARQVAEEAGADVSFKVTLLQQFKAREAMLAHVNQSGADIVVLGTRGHTTLRNLLMGSTAEKIIHGSRCSALAVKPAGFEYALE
jgi:universal stress protein E